MQMLTTVYIYGMVNRNLVTMNTKGKWIPMIVKSIPSLENKQAVIYTENGVKKLKAKWEILPNVQWGDGTAVTGEDVKFAWEVGLNPNVSVGERDVYDQVEKIEIDAKNPKKFTFIYKKAKWDFNQLGTFYILPKHLEEPIYKQFSSQNEGYAKNSLYTKDPTNPGLYCGPYKITDIKLGSHVALAVNDKFYGAKPKIKKLILKLIPSNGTLEANLRSGTIDMISEIGFTFDQAVAFEKKSQENKWPYKTNFKQSLTYEHIDLNLDNPILADIKVRKALVYALDRQKLVKALFEGKQKMAIHNLNPIDPWYTEDPKSVVLYPTDKKKAAQLMDEAGWKRGKDGMRYKDGQKMSLTFMTTAGNKTRELVQVFLQKEWHDVGVDIQIKNEPPRVFFSESAQKRKFTGMIMYAWISAPENNPKSTLHSVNIPTEKNGWSGQNFPDWKNAEADKIMDEIDITFSDAKRKELAHKILKLYSEDVPVIPLFYRTDVSVTPVNQAGYELTGHQFTSSNFVENWNLQ